MSQKIYPCWRYNQAGEGKIIQSEAEEHPDWKWWAPSPECVLEIAGADDEDDEDESDDDHSKLSKKELVAKVVEKGVLEEKAAEKLNKAQLIEHLK